MGIAGAALGSAIAIAMQAGLLALIVWRYDGHLFHVMGWRNGTLIATLSFVDMMLEPAIATI
ncbi:hypothetical protein N9770_07425 [Amylibacter sp.]|nr:hypothetical protein [Amylibacter sp.]